MPAFSKMNTVEFSIDSVPQGGDMNLSKMHVCRGDAVYTSYIVAINDGQVQL